MQSSKLREFITLEADTGVSHLSWQGEREGEGEIGDRRCQMGVPGNQDESHGLCPGISVCLFV